MKEKMLNAKSIGTVEKRRGTLYLTWNSSTRPLGSIKRIKERICNKNQRDTICNR